MVGDTSGVGAASRQLPGRGGVGGGAVSSRGRLDGWEVHYLRLPAAAAACGGRSSSGVGSSRPGRSLVIGVGEQQQMRARGSLGGRAPPSGQVATGCGHESQ